MTQKIMFLSPVMHRAMKGLAFTSLLISLNVNAQVSGTKTIGVDYATLAAAIADLNTNGISGSVTINVPAAYTETAPAGGFVLGSSTLNASISGMSSLVFQKNGMGANPLLTAFTGTTTTLDGVFIIRGTDNVTIDGIDVTESVANTTATTRMEWGYALLKLQNTAPFDGCQNVTIKNCTVTLNKANANTVGIYAANHITTATTSLAITETTDATNNCKFYGNTIQNTITGISLRGYSAAASPYTLYDQNNDIGGSAGTTGNTIRNYAGSSTGAGVNLQYQNGANVSYNMINNIAGGGTAGTTILYGIYTQNGTNASVNVTNNNIRLTQGTTSSATYAVNTSCSGTGTVNVNNNTITANGGSTGAMYMIYFGAGNGTVNTNNNNFANINVATTSTLGLIYHASAATTANITCSNNVTSGVAAPYVNKTGSGGTVAGYYNNSGSSAGFTNITNNNFSNINLAGSPTFYGVFDNNGGTGQNKAQRNNTISNVTSVGGTLYGLWAGFSATECFSNNTVFNLNAGTGSAYGIYVNSSSSLDSVVSNAIHSLSSAGGSVYGINIAGGTVVNVYLNTVNALTTSGTTGTAYGIRQTSGTTVNVFRNKIYDISATGTGSSVNGMYFNSGSVTAYNNLVGDLRTPNFNGASGTQLVGIYLGGGTAHQIYYNTVYINGTSTGADFGSTAIFSSTTPAVTLRNNIFVNTSVPNGLGKTVAYRRSSTTLTTYQASSNNNLFYAGVPGASRLIFHDGTDPYITMIEYKALVDPRDVSSVTENPPFISTVGSSPAFLHISTAIPTQIESGAINITGFTTDYDSVIRQGNPGYTGTGTAPDIGADEGNFMPTDLSAPNIVYTVLTSACTTGDRVLSATINDASGVPTSGTLMPRIYFRKNFGTWFSLPGTLAGGSATSGTWNFTISAASMGGLSVGDTVSYFVIAQDVASPVNIGSNPSTGLVASDVNTISVFPEDNSYVVIPTLSGTYNVGVGMAYATITDAVAAYNTSCVSGPVVFQLMDATYPSETFPITINANISASATNTLTIRPAAGASPVISGLSTSAIFVLNGADYVTIDGSNSPVTNSVCPLSVSSRDMLIENTSTSTTSAVVWMQTVSADGATHNTIRNCNISGSGNSFTLYGIGSGGTAITLTSTGAGNSFNRIENNSIVATQTGIYTRGASAANKNEGTVINLNEMVGTAGDNLRNNGILTGFENNITISGNKIANITNGISQDIIAISLGFNNNATSTSITTGNEVTNATVTNNKLDNISQTNTFSCLGIAVAGTTSGTTTIANNMISGVISKGTAGDFSSGIFIGGAAGGTTNVFYNSVNITGTLTGGSYPNYAIAISGTNPIVNIKNNIFVNNNTVATASLQYAIGLAYTTYTNLSSDRNDFFSVGPNVAKVGSLTTTGTSYPTVEAWSAATGNDANSHEVNPVFASASDLHVLPVAANAPLMDSGIAVSITTDYDCAPRSSTPDIGLNEFTIPPCTGITAGTASAATPSFCGSGSTTLSLTGATTDLGVTYQWQASPDTSFWASIPGATTSTYTTPPLTATTYYRAILTCTFAGVSDTAATFVTIHPLPIIDVTPDGGSICASGSGLSMTASGASTYTWSPATGLSASTGATVIANPTSNTTYTVTGTDVFGCIGTHSLTVAVSYPPDSFTVSPATITMCEGDPAHLLEAVGAAVTPSSGAVTQSSGTVSVTITDASAVGARDTISLAGIPAGATITGISVNFNINMTYDGDLTLNLTAPNGNTFNLVNRRGGSGDNFINTTVSSAGGLAFSSSAAPFTNTYAADAGTTGGTTSLPITTTSWAGLFSIPNGNWIFSGRDWVGGDVATITSWSITVNYTYNPAITWSPTTGLYTDAGATVAYTGGATTTVYATPAATTTYTATLTLGGCSNTAEATVSVNPAPTAYAVTGGGAYCAGGAGVVVGLANSETGISYQLYNGATATGSAVAGTGAAISFGLQTDAGTYSVLATNTSTTCTNGMLGTATITIDPVPTAYAVTGGGTYCAGGTGFPVGLSGSDVGTNYQLYNGVTAVGTPVAGTGGAISFGLQTAAGTYTVLATSTATGCTNSMSASAVIVVNPLPPVFVVTGGGAYCTGGTGVNIGLSGSTVGANYQLYNGASTVGAPVSGTGGPISFGLQTAVGTYTVLATNVTTSCTNVMIGSAVITINPLPGVQTVTGGGSYCAGGAGVAIGLSGSESGVVYQLYNGAALITTVSGTGAAISFGLQTGGGTYTVVATNTTTSCTSNMAGTAAITVDPLPVAFAVTGGGIYCAGGSGVTVGLSGSAIGINYQLYNGTSPVGTVVSGTGGAISFGLQTAAGIYTVSATNSTTGCTNDMAGSADVIIGALPASYAITGGGSYCIGGTGVDISMSGSEVGVNYQLYNGATAVGTPVAGTGGVISFGLQTAVGTYSAVGTNATTSCSANMFSSVTVTTNPLPAVYTLTGGGVYCAGGIGVNVGLSNSDIGISYQLYNNAGAALGSPLAGTGLPLDFGPQTDSGNYSVIATNISTGCASLMGGTAYIFINPTVPPSVSITSAAGLTVCTGTTVTFTANPVNGGFSPTYQWSVNGVNTGTGVTFSYVPANGDVVTVLITSSPCASPDTGSSSVVMAVVPFAMPTVSVTTSVGGSSSCAGNPVTFTAMPVLGGTAPAFKWIQNGIAVATGPTYTYIPADGDIIRVVMYSSFACRLADSVVSSNIVMDVLPVFTPVVTINSFPGLSISPGQSDTFTAIVSGAGPAPTYQWRINGVAVPGATTFIFITNTLSNGDAVSISVTSSGPCGGITTTKTVYMNVGSTGVNTVATGMVIRLAPNPNKGTFNIKGSMPGNEDVYIEVLDMLGQTVYKSSITPKNGEIDELINLNNNLANGMYMLNVRSGNEAKTFHFVMEQ
jgi:subtilisin-like proprotein convertase family protein